MEIAMINSHRKYKALVRDFYRGDPDFVNNKSGLIDLVCKTGSVFYRLSTQEMIGVLRGDTFACIAVLVNHKNDPENLMMAFFECRDDSFDEVSFLAEYAADFGRNLGCKKLIVSLDGHCNNSVGFLSKGEGRPGFGQSYNPVHYNDFFRRLGFNEIRLLSCKGDISKLNVRLFDFARRQLPRGIVFSTAEFGFRGFRRTMKLYTDLNNEIFKNHRYCFFREYDEDYELFLSMRPLLDNDNMIFAERDGETIGFVLWYPDFNELVPKGGQAGIGTVLKYRLLGKEPSAVKAVQIGVLPEYENSGLILALFGEFYRLATGKHKKAEVCLSSWILAENKKSVKLSTKILPEPYREMSSYEKEI